VKVLIVDDQRVVREGLATIVGAFADMEVVGLAEDGVQALELAASTGPDVVLMDLRMPRMDGVEATKALRERYPDVSVVVLTTFADDDSIIAALSAGASGYLTKDAARDDIRRALEAAVAGQTVLDPVVQAALLKAAQTAPIHPARPAPLPDGLTEREVEVLVLIADGLSNTEIAGRLYVAETTIKTHVNRIFAKTNSRDRMQAAVYAHQHGLAEGPPP
jgi:DNA-binding NarL/FixJ family response regulator